MADKIKKELLDVDLKGVNIEIQHKLTKSVELVEKISEMLMNIGIPFQFSDLVDSWLYMFPQLNNEDICIAFLFWYIWAFSLDDHLGRNHQDFWKWHKILDGGACIEDGKIEKMYQLFLKSTNAAITNTKSVDELLRLTKDWLENFEILHVLSNDEMSDEQFLELRLRDFGMLPSFYFIQIDAALEVTKELASDENWIKLRYNVILHLTIMNELFSLKKEVVAGQEKTNYIYVKMKNNNLSAQEAVQQLLIEANNAEKMARFHARKLKESYEIDGLDAYVDALFETMVGNIYWSSICKRYNDF